MQDSLLSNAYQCLAQLKNIVIISRQS